MRMKAKAIVSCLWFDSQAEEAANHYASIFENSKVGKISRYSKEGQDIHGKEPGSVMTVEFEIGGQKFLALNGGPQFKFSSAVSFVVNCETQQEVDHFWDRLSDGGEPLQCGWLKDKYGLSWQIVPTIMVKLLQDKDAAKSPMAVRQLKEELEKTRAIFDDLTAKRKAIDDQLKMLSRQQDILMSQMEKLGADLQDLRKKYPETDRPRKP